MYLYVFVTFITAPQSCSYIAIRTLSLPEVELLIFFSGFVHFADRCCHYSKEVHNGKSG